MKPNPRDMKSGRSLETWESWVDEAIQEARDRGDFDNLPGHGKPLKLERNPLAGDREVGFHALKNANLLPHWMELDRELARKLADLESFREHSAARLARLRERACEQAVMSVAPSRESSIRRWLLGESSFWRTSDPAIVVGSVERERGVTRRQYLERAAVADKQIQGYNAALPDEIRWLERARLLPDQAAAHFDAACPPILCEGRDRSI